ncbi:6-phosphogluconolactonase [Meiothermus sp. CFH 77666]|uniref:6-phosphogluconolactonase n=1 Tax=Meiothermus sp. CFH 77666 TaxID=2817942 RepID=UPI001AA08B16|nr:6-phosphogluconolactonase [Meiothermus sp. CFH 77666]MBO1438016.1 6-phosphogluconolactonase [Meiothermus sp. CFH 77666]
MADLEVQTCTSTEEVAQALADLLAEHLQRGGSAVLAGGQTPLPAYQLLARLELPWPQIHLIPSDERCVKPSSPLRNDLQILAALGEKAPLHRFPAELGPSEAASQMEAVVRALLPFELVVLGMGEDGHTASLFPGHPNYETLVAPVYNAPKPPPERVTLTPKALSQTRLLVFVVTGEGKRETLRQVLARTPLPPNQIPAPRRLLLCDRAAYPHPNV